MNSCSFNLKDLCQLRKLEVVAALTWTVDTGKGQTNHTVYISCLYTVCTLSAEYALGIPTVYTLDTPWDHVCHVMSRTQGYHQWHHTYVDSRGTIKQDWIYSDKQTLQKHLGDKQFHSASIILYLFTESLLSACYSLLILTFIYTSHVHMYTLPVFLVALHITYIYLLSHNLHATCMVPSRSWRIAEVML